jgi:hypothetical protein
MTRVLAIDDSARAKVAQVLAHAVRHHYRPGPGAAPPGEDERFVAQFDTYRCVFSFTHDDGTSTIWRHLSVGVPGKKYPNLFAVFTIAALFGFTGWDERTIDPAPEGWEIDIVSKKPRHIVVGQPVEGH